MEYLGLLVTRNDNKPIGKPIEIMKNMTPPTTHKIVLSSYLYGVGGNLISSLNNGAIMDYTTLVINV